MAEAKKDEKQLLKAVLQFLKKTNLKATEDALKSEAGIDEEEYSSVRSLSAVENVPDINSLLAEYENEGDPLNYAEYYKGLQDFIGRTLDIHRPEMSLVLYPLFVHLYLELVYKELEVEANAFFAKFEPYQEGYRQEDLRKLKCITKRDHMFCSNEILDLFRSSKYVIRISRETFGMLKKYLQENQRDVILNIIQQHFHLDVFDGRPRKKRNLGAGTGGISGEAPQYANNAKVFYGLIHDPELNASLEEDSDEEEDKEKPKKKKSKRDEAKKRQATDPHAPKPERISFPSLKDSDKRLKLAKYKELLKRLHVGPNSLPSICFYTVLNASQGLNVIEFSDDSKMLAAGFDDSSIKLWSLTPRKLRTLKAPYELARIDKEADDVLERIMNERSATEQKTLLGHSGPVYGLSFNENNSFLVSSSEDGTVRLWSLHTFTNLVVYKGHTFPVWSVKFCPKGFYFASVSADRTARLWSTDSHTPLRIFAGHLADLNAIDFHPNCNYIATGSSDRTVRVWDILTGNSVRLFTGHKGAVHAVAFSPDGKHLVSSGVDKRILLWNIADGVPVIDLTGHTEAVFALSFSRDGHVLASATQ
ncbi:transcription initiation factor TFIID subunit 5-like isoform X2 [Rhopilema esculentum]|uniref:transcription initiation factor TFIID subunit 5-like isoform X2 n=1 Tax=Rhopilema esculentum TaxID=499914 RepID=UPI0031D31D64